MSGLRNVRVASHLGWYNVWGGIMSWVAQCQGGVMSGWHNVFFSWDGVMSRWRNVLFSWGGIMSGLHNVGVA